MRDPEWHLALFGTFDVENYGDLLFPLIAESELTERLGPVKLHPFSYHPRTPPDWPYTVVSLTELPEMASTLDGALIGGGFIIRFDKDVAPGYGPPTPTIHHPTGYWLTPALIALQHGVPLIWNAPGMHCNDIPSWADPLMELAFTHSRYIAVRDRPSQSTLARFVDKAQIAVVPDTAFGISRLLDASHPSVEFTRLREASGLTNKYIIVQAAEGLEPFSRFVKTHSDRLRDFRFLALPIGPVLGDDKAILGDDIPGLVRLPVWPHPLILAELIRGASGVVGHSYHLAISALAFGVPVFSSTDRSVGKYTALSDFDAIYPLPNEIETDPDLFLSRLGKTAPSQAARAASDQLAHHWDRIATIIRAGATDTKPALDRFWQSLPGALEAETDRREAAVQTLEMQTADLRLKIDEQTLALAASQARSVETQQHVDELIKLLALARLEIAGRDERIARLYHSPSWRVTAPARYLMRTLKRLVGK